MLCRISYSILKKKSLKYLKNYIIYENDTIKTYWLHTITFVVVISF